MPVKQRIGFTLVEMLIVIGIIGLMIPAFFSIIFVIMQQQARIIALQEVKRQGDFILNTLENTIHGSAQAIYDDNSDPIASSGLTETKQVCDVIHNASFAQAPPVHLLTFKDHSGNGFRFVIDGGQVASQSAIPSASTAITTDKVVVSLNGANPFLQCDTGNQFSPPVVTVNYKVTYAVASVPTSMSYQVKIKLKSY
ncbi:type II secretion system GspH family protein [Patescibacteria group bacterium]|nr:type II secretion system GspH family protein [Patescibacteria group bacterium]MCL5091866.1 type II secretion system GspH family protein [Patescibacteria group bacterium]